MNLNEKAFCDFVKVRKEADLHLLASDWKTGLNPVDLSKIVFDPRWVVCGHVKETEIERWSVGEFKVSKEAHWLSFKSKKQSHIVRNCVFKKLWKRSKCGCGDSTGCEHNRSSSISCHFCTGNDVQSTQRCKMDCFC
ncbi:hypothetical protein PoB_003307000 [Plakobranchus ocellatus]|uniref:Uncharacterized protein n=1 Tax=Plakobranchus ocellatus TaxID=259542 RepID=A0AAV4AEG4_9GAST|nr:hypothetical protein PoB_003307000 [Plakobranchus ocellatus]